MIKLEELKQGDIVYKISGFEWCHTYKISKEKHSFEYQSLDGDITYVVEAENITQPFYKIQIFFKRDELDLFKTENEAREQMKKHRADKKLKLQKDNNLIEYLYEMSKSRLAEQHRILVREIINEMEDK